MNKLTTLILGSSLAFSMSTGFAAATDMGSNWNCTTNASSAANDTEKAADEKMAQTHTAAADAFVTASQNCRDCTKITCEVKQ